MGPDLRIFKILFERFLVRRLVKIGETDGLDTSDLLATGAMSLVRGCLLVLNFFHLSREVYD